MHIRKKIILGLAISAGLLFGFSISLGPGVSAQLVDENGRPIAGAYVLVFHLTPAPGISLRQPVAYRTDRALIRPDAAGRFRIPRQLHFHLPFFQFIRPPRFRLSIYVPGLHNFCRIEDAQAWQVDEPCASGQMQTVAGPPERELKFFDLSARPEHWYYSLFQLVYTLRFDQGRPDPDQRELAAAMRKDYEQFAGQYGGTVREIKRDGFVWIDPEGRAQFQGQQRPWGFYLGREWLGKTLLERITEIEHDLKPEQ
jgi:hypothetical protein